MYLPIRKSPRWSEYDYSSEGCYFVTIVCKNRECYFGNIRRDVLLGRPQMILNDLGKYCHEYIKNLTYYRKTIEIHEFVIMPNHIHLLLAMSEFTDNMNTPIIDYRGNDNGNGRDALLGRPQIDEKLYRGNDNGNGRDALLGRPQIDEKLDGRIDEKLDGRIDEKLDGRIDEKLDGRIDEKLDGRIDEKLDGRPKRASLQHYKGPTLGSIINMLKGNITKYANYHNISFARQSRYHDHIVRNSIEYEKIKYYIRTNPQNRESDRFTEII